MSDNNSSVAAWVALPRGRRGPRKYISLADELRSRPGDWAQLTEQDSVRAAYNLADNIRRGRLVAFRPAGSFEAMTRKTTVTARYVGKEET
jgi:hypothetical protein